MKAAHTPGPWSVHPHMDGDHTTDCAADGFVAHAVYIGAGDVLIGSFEAYKHSGANEGYPRTTDFDVNRANARLAIAAPDLLAALKGLLARHSDGSQEGPWSEWDTANEAVAKAGATS